MKITKTNLQIGMKFNQKGNQLHLCRYEYDADKFLKLEWMKADLEGSEITITELCKSYGGSGQMVRYTIDGQPGEFLSFWSDFKSNTEYIDNDDIVIVKATPKNKVDKVWTEKQLERLGKRGYYITYYGLPTDLPSEFGITYIGNGKCLYLHHSVPPNSEWATLSWVSAPTKGKIEKALKDTDSMIERYIYFETYAKLIKFPNISYQPGASKPANPQEEREITLNKILESNEK